MPASNEQTDRSCEHIASLSKSQLCLEIKDECAVCFHNLDGGVKSQVSNLIEACENHVNSKENHGQVPPEGQSVSKITELGNTCLSSNHTRKLKSSKYTLFSSLSDKHNNLKVFNDNNVLNVNDNNELDTSLKLNDGKESI